MLMKNEINIYRAINAIDDEKIENHHIPKVYYHGKFLGIFYAIALSLFDGTLADYYNNPREKHLSELDIIYIFLQTVCKH